MTRVHALRMLLQHGPLRMDEIVVITGWRYCVARHVVRRCRAAGVLVSRNLSGWPYHYALAGGAGAAGQGGAL